MKFTTEQIRTTHAEFSKRRNRLIMLTIPLVLLILALVTGSDGDAQGSGILFVPGMILFFLLLIASYWTWRCPHCGKFLGRDSGYNPRFCRRCGIPLAKNPTEPQ